MKFTIEIVRARDGANGKVLHSVVVDVIREPELPRAEELLRAWGKRGATNDRVQDGEVIFSWRAGSPPT